MTACPMNNVDEFRHRVNELAALLLDKQAADAAIKDLQTADVDISTVRVLHGEEGADTLDPTGAEHGFATRIIRWLQTRGYDRHHLVLPSYVGGAVRPGHPGGRDPSLEVVDDRPGCEHANAKI